MPCVCLPPGFGLGTGGRRRTDRRAEEDSLGWRAGGGRHENRHDRHYNWHLFGGGGWNMAWRGVVLCGCRTGRGVAWRGMAFVACARVVEPDRRRTDRNPLSLILSLILSLSSSATPGFLCTATTTTISFFLSHLPTMTDICFLCLRQEDKTRKEDKTVNRHLIGVW